MGIVRLHIVSIDVNHSSHNRAVQCCLLPLCGGVFASFTDDDRQENTKCAECGVGAELSDGHDIDLPVIEGFFSVLMASSWPETVWPTSASSMQIIFRRSSSVTKLAVSGLSSRTKGMANAVTTVKSLLVLDTQRQALRPAVPGGSTYPGSTGFVLDEASSVRDKPSHSTSNCNRHEEVCHAQRDMTLVVKHGQLYHKSQK